MYPACIPMYLSVSRWIHEKGGILMSPMCIPKTSNMSWVRFCIRLYSNVSRMYSTCTLDVFHMYPDRVQDTLAYKRDTSEYMQNTLGYKNGHVFQALGRVRSRAQLDAHRIRLEYIGIRSGYARICIPQQIAESEAEYDGIRVEYVTIRNESAKCSTTCPEHRGPVPQGSPRRSSRAQAAQAQAAPSPCPFPCPSWGHPASAVLALA